MEHIIEEYGVGTAMLLIGSCAIAAMEQLLTLLAGV